jgi:hypothetical protein
MTAVSIEQPATLDLALKQLAEVVRDRIARGRSTRSAGIKSVLAEKFDGTFDQRAYGFDTFRRFLEEAERRGVISIANAPIGPDVDLTVPGQPTSDVSSSASGGTRVRRDLWRAFVHWEVGGERFWNVRMMKVVELGNQSPSTAQASGLVAISPISPDRVKSWMQDFAEQTSDTIKATLIGSLQTLNPFRQFRGATDELGQTRQWRHYLQTKVVGVISDWICTSTSSRASQPTRPSPSGRPCCHPPRRPFETRCKNSSA